MTPPEHDTECPQPSQRGHGLDSRARNNLSTDWPSRSQVKICNEVDNLVDEPGVTGHRN